MKKKILALLVLVTIMTNTTFAKEITVNNQVLAAFTEEFADASAITWEKSENYYKASFDFNSQHLTAYISEDGVIIGVKRNLLTVDLPINLQLSFKKKYSDHWVTELFEYASNGETNYYMSIENADQKTILQSAGSSLWTVFSRKAK